MQPELFPIFIYFVCFLAGSIPVSRIVLKGGPSRRSQAIIAVLNTVKGALPVLAILFQSFGAMITQALPFLDEAVASHWPSPWAAALFVLAGHAFCPWLRPQDGKGSTVALGAFGVLSPLAAVIGVLLASWVYFFRRYWPMASMCGLIGGWVSYLVVNELSVHAIFVGLAVFLVLLRYEEEIDGLLLEG